MLTARPNATILDATLAKGPKPPLEYQYNSTRHFMRELNGLGVTSVCDAGGGVRLRVRRRACSRALRHAKHELVRALTFAWARGKPLRDSQVTVLAHLLGV